MRAVRRILATAGLTGTLLLAASGSAWAVSGPTPSTDPSASPTATASPSDAATPTPTATASPSEEATPTPTASTDPSPEPSSGCEPDPTICQDNRPGVHPGTTTDCGQVDENGVASPAPPGTVCIAGGLNPGTTSGSGAGSPQLPLTGPPPVLPILAVSGTLVLLGLLAIRAGRRRAVHV